MSAPPATRPPKSILYVGSTEGTSGARCVALKALGHTIQIINPYEVFSGSRLFAVWNFRTGAMLTSMTLHAVLKRQTAGKQFDLTIVDNGELIDRSSVQLLRKVSRRVVLFNLDNPHTNRDGLPFHQVRRALPLYDAVFYPRASSVASALAAGARKAVQFWQAADDIYRDVLNHPSASEMEPFVTDVSFTGTWMEGRDEFAKDLIDRGIDLRVYGPRWEKSPNYEHIKSHTRLANLSQREFASAIAASKISVCLLSAGNLDLHTTRSMEIPTLRSVLVAPRTTDHEALYVHGTEAFFWSSVDECAAIIRRLVSDPLLTARVRNAGFERALCNNNYNIPLMEFVVSNSL